MRMQITNYCDVTFTKELIMLRTGILYTPDCEWSRLQIECMLTVKVLSVGYTLAIVISISIVFIFILLYYLLCVPCVRISFK